MNKPKRDHPRQRTQHVQRSLGELEVPKDDQCGLVESIGMMGDIWWVGAIWGWRRSRSWEKQEVLLLNLDFILGRIKGPWRVSNKSFRWSEHYDCHMENELAMGSRGHVETEDEGYCSGLGKWWHGLDWGCGSKDGDISWLLKIFLI